MVATFLTPLQHRCGCVVAKVAVVCTAPCVWFGRFSAFLLPFQIEEAKGTSVTTVTRRTIELLVKVPSFMDGNIYYFVVVEDNDKNM